MVRHLQAALLLFKHSLGPFTIHWIIMVVIARAYVLGSANWVPSIVSLQGRFLLNTFWLSFHLLLIAILNGERLLVRTFLIMINY